LSDFQRNQSEILIIPPNFSNLILKNCNKLIAKNLARRAKDSGLTPDRGRDIFRNKFITIF